MNEITTIEQTAPPVAQSAPDTPSLPVERVLQAVIAAASDPAVDVAKMRELLNLQKELLAMRAEAEFTRSLMQLPAIHVPKNGRIDLGGKGSIPFAKWEDMAKIIEPLLETGGFRLMFDSQVRPGEGGGLVVTGTLLHRDGHSRSASMPLALDAGPGRNNLQAMGSSLSYGKRYTTEMLLNIVREADDDDGKSGGKKFITSAEADELRALAKDAERQEGQFLHQFFEGDDGAARSFDEIETGPAYTAVKNTLRRLAGQKRRATA